MTDPVLDPIENGTLDANAQNIHGFTALMIACHANNFELIKTLIETFEADPNLKDTEDRTALYFACAEGNRKIVRYLLINGADVDGYDNLLDAVETWSEIRKLNGIDNSQYPGIIKDLLLMNIKTNSKAQWFKKEWTQFKQEIREFPRKIRNKPIRPRGDGYQDINRIISGEIKLLTP